MRKLLFVLFLTTCGLMTAFGQLKVSNDFGQDLNVTVNGQKNLVPYKGVKTFNVSGRQVWLECVSMNGKIKFSIQKKVSRSGLVSIAPGDDVPVSTQSSQTQSSVETVIQSYSTSTTPAPPTYSSTSSSSLDAILKGSGKPNTQTTSQTTYATTVTASPPYTTSVTVVPNQAQNQTPFEKVHVIYEGSERFKVFSDIAGGRWQGVEFRGTQSNDSTRDNAKNEYYIYIQKDRDVHIGVVFNPDKSINEYGEFRKRLNKEDTVLYIKSNEIKKMSTDKKKMIRIKLNALDYSIYFEPEDAGSKKGPISLRHNKWSRKFEAPIGQFYLKVSCTDSREMFHPTVYIPVHVANADNDVIINRQSIDKAMNSDLNLNWSRLRDVP